MGRGFFVVNVAAEQRKQVAADVRRAQVESRAEMMRTAFDAVVAEMNAVYGPFDTNTELGVDLLNSAVFRATGSDLSKHRNQRISA